MHENSTYQTHIACVTNVFISSQDRTISAPRAGWDTVAQMMRVYASRYIQREQYETTQSSTYQEYGIYGMPLY